MREATQQLMTPEEVSDLLQVPVATLYGWRYKGLGPPAVRVGRHLRYRRSDIEVWFDKRGEAEQREAGR